MTLVGIYVNGNERRAAIINKSFDIPCMTKLDNGAIQVYVVGEIRVDEIEPIARYVIEKDIRHNFD